MGYQFKNKIKQLFYDIYSNHIDFPEGNTFANDKKIAIDYFKKEPTLLLNLLSSQTFCYLEELIDDSESVLKEEYTFNEDFFILICAGVLRYRDGFEINPKFKPIIKQLLKVDVVDKCFTYVSVHTFLKGLVDIYGYIEIKDLKKIASQIFKKNISISLILDVFKHNWIIQQFCVNTRKYICRKEIYRMKKDFLEARSVFELDYKYYEQNQVIDFANSFDFNTIIPFYESKKDTIIKTSKCLSLELNPLEGTLLNHFKDDDKAQDFFNYNLKYPKWVLKGNTLQDITEDIILTGTSGIIDA